MNFKQRKACDKCKGRKAIKRYSIMRHFNYGYGYIGFDLCDDCADDLGKILESFLPEVFE